MFFDIGSKKIESTKDARPPSALYRGQPIYVQADKIISGSSANRVIVQGNVEIYYSTYILTADEVILDRAANKLSAEGHAQLKAPNGEIVRADRLEATDDFREAFAT